MKKNETRIAKLNIIMKNNCNYRNIFLCHSFMSIDIFCIYLSLVSLWLTLMLAEIGAQLTPPPQRSLPFSNWVIIMAGLADVRVEESLRIKIGEYVRKCSNVHLCFISVVQLLTRPSIPSIQNLLLFQHKQKNCRPNIRIMCGPKTEQQQKGKERKIKREEEGDESKKKKGNNITQRKQQSCEKKRKKKNRGWACSLSLSLTFY